MARQIEVPAAGAPGAGAVVTLYPIGGADPVENAEDLEVVAHGSKPGSWLATLPDVPAVPAADYDFRFTTAGGVLLSMGRRAIGTADGIYALGSTAELSAALISHLETQARAKGGVSYLQSIEICLAALAGAIAASGGDESFKFLDGTTAFTSTVSGGNRAVAIE